jgi:hypothetical protein
MILFLWGRFLIAHGSPLVRRNSKVVPSILTRRTALPMKMTAVQVQQVRPEPGPLSIR